MENKRISCKGYILVDVPENCRDCDFYGFTCRITNKKSKYYDEEGKPDWCPIREFPERKEPSKFTVSPMIPCQYTEYNKGWNDCIKQMEVER